MDNPNDPLVLCFDRINKYFAHPSTEWVHFNDDLSFSNNSMKYKTYKQDFYLELSKSNTIVLHLFDLSGNLIYQTLIARGTHQTLNVNSSSYTQIYPTKHYVEEAQGYSNVVEKLKHEIKSILSTYRSQLE